MSYGDTPKVRAKKFLQQINIWVEPETKEMYRHLNQVGINSAEVLRRVIQRELKRLCEIAPQEFDNGKGD